MRLLYISDNLSDHNLRFLRKFSEHGLEVFFLDISKPAIPASWPPPQTRVVTLKTPVSSTLSPRDIENRLHDFRQLLRDVCPDVIQAGPLHTAGYMTALSEFHPLVIMPWGSDILQYPSHDHAAQVAIQHALEGSDAMFCDCQAVRQAVKRLVDFPDERIAQFPWGLERGKFSPVGPSHSRSDLGFAAENFVLLCTRSWEPIYSIPTLLRSFEAAYRQRRDLRLILLGDGSQAGQVHEFISQRGLGTVVATPGVVPRSELPAWFRAADSYVSCTISDGVSISLLEAMATGLPVILTDNPSNREWIADGQNGFLGVTNQAESFAEKILRAADLDAAARAAISETNRAIVAERADWDRNFPQLLSLFDAVVETGAAVRA